MSLDYTPLGSPLTKQDLAGVSGEGVDKSSMIIYGAFAVVGVFIFVVSALAIFIYSSAPIWPTALVVGGASAITGCVLYNVMSKRKRYLARMVKFANANKLTFQYDLQPGERHGLIFDEGHTRRIRDVLQLDNRTEVGNFRYITGSGKTQSTLYFTFARVRLTRKLPHMVLDSTENNNFGISNLPDVMHTSQKLKLEGDFNKYFTLYAPKQYETDALYVFTPDVMQSMIDASKKYDAEIIDDEMYFYAAGSIDLSSEQLLRDVQNMLSVVDSQIEHQTKRYSDTRAEQPGVTIAPQGQRLKSASGTVALVGTVSAIILYAVFSTIDDTLTAGYLVMIVAGPTIFGFTLMIKRIMDRS